MGSNLGVGVMKARYGKSIVSGTKKAMVDDVDNASDILSNTGTLSKSKEPEAATGCVPFGRCVYLHGLVSLTSACALLL